MFAVLPDDKVAYVRRQQNTACDYLRQFFLINGVQVDLRVPLPEVLLGNRYRCHFDLRTT